MDFRNFQVVETDEAGSVVATYIQSPSKAKESNARIDVIVSIYQLTTDFQDYI